MSQSRLLIKSVMVIPTSIVILGHRCGKEDKECCVAGVVFVHTWCLVRYVLYVFTCFQVLEFNFPTINDHRDLQFLLYFLSLSIFISKSGIQSTNLALALRRNMVVYDGPSVALESGGSL